MINVALIGVFAGIISGLLGVGGGTITIPALVILLGTTQQLAQGVSLAAIVPIAITGAYGYIIRKKADIKTAIMLGAGSVFGSIIGATYANIIAHQNLKMIFGVFAVTVGVKIIYDVFSAKK